MSVLLSRWSVAVGLLLYDMYIHTPDSMARCVRRSLSRSGCHAARLWLPGLLACGQAGAKDPRSGTTAIDTRSLIDRAAPGTAVSCARPNLTTTALGERTIEL